ncbi:MAG: Gfo/Idh/MocA family oxidoreductase [Agathobacter sp.]|nr:Gfo/Idh/MocA family oxidoreductase [Agathobacter sp.]
MKKVITYGTYDLFHQGHYNLLKRAKELGDYLIVGVTTDHFDEARGKLNVVDSTLERVENVRKTGLADKIIIEEYDGQKIEDIQRYGVDIFTVGSDWIGTFDYLNEYCEVVYLERTPNVSSTQLREDRFEMVRIGIVGTGEMAARFFEGSKYVSGVDVVSVYNPEKEDGTRFQREYDIPCIFENYEGFLDGVDAVYIASPNETHFVYAKTALENGKHVLCENPLAFTRKEAESLYALAKEKHLVLLAAVKTAYCPGFQQLINVAKSGVIGEIRDVEAAFTRLADEDSTERTDVEFGGSLLEFGSYTLLPIFKLLGTDYKDVQFYIMKDEKGVDIYTKVYAEYEQAIATAKTGVAVKSEGQLVISGTKGYILAESPWWLTKKFVVRFEDPTQIETYNPVFQGDGLRYEISEFVSQINGRGKKGYKLTAEETIAMADITEKYMQYKKGSM